MEGKFESACDAIYRHAGTEHIEIEMRLGVIDSRGHFDTNIGKERWYKIHGALEAYNDWSSKCMRRSDTVFMSGDSVRVIVDEKTSARDVHIKKRVKTIDVKLTEYPLDVRFSIATEEPCELGDNEVRLMRRRERSSFSRKNVCIDMTISTEEVADIDAETDTSYQVELEVIDPLKLRDTKDIKNITHKIFCLLDTLQM